MPRVSVIIPCYNYAHLVGRAIRSVLEQTYTDFEIIVVDDGSTDNIPEVVAGFAGRVRYIRQPNQGPNGARNQGIRAASGEFIALLDPDDEWLPRKLERQMTIMDSQPTVGLVYANVYLVEGLSGSIIGTYPSRLFRKGHVLQYLYLHQFVPSPTPLIRRLVFDRVGYFDPNAIGSDDWDMWLRIAAQFEFAYVAEPLAKYAVHASWGSHTTYQTYERDMLTFLKKSAMDYPAELGRVYRFRLSTFMEQLGWHLVRRGECVAGLQRLRYAISCQPWRVRLYLLLALAILGPRMTRERYRLGRVAYLQAKYNLFNYQYSQARAEFAYSIRMDPLSSWKVYAGLVLAVIGRPATIFFKIRSGLDLVAMVPPPDSAASFQEW